MSTYRDLEPDGEPRGTALFLPGRAYTCDGPLLMFTAFACLQAGWRVRQVWWQPDGPDTDWVYAEAERAAEGTDPGLVVGKSLGTRATGWAARRRLPAIWLTPLMDDPGVLAGIRTNPSRQLLVGGTADPFWATPPLPEHVETLEVEGADHVVAFPGDAVATAAAHVTVAERVTRWLSAGGA